MANKVGRPPRKPQSTADLQSQAIEGIKRTQKRYKEDLVTDVERLTETVDGITHRNRFTQVEMDELKQKVNALYDEIIVGQMADDMKMWSATDARIDADLAEVSLASVKPMSEEEWNKLHRLRPNGKRKPGPKPGKKKNIYSIEPGDKGLAMERTPSQDCDELERQWMESYIQEQKNEPQFLQGKRVRNGTVPMKPMKPASNFWI